MALSDEIDTYADRPAAESRKEDRDALTEIGVGSRFVDTHGFYVDGVGPDTAKMPSDWRERARSTVLRTDPSILVTVPELGDVALSKMVARSIRTRQSRSRSAG